jgi:hypothetical protein
MRDARALDVAAALNIPCVQTRGASGGSLYQCPACGAERRHAARRDRRGAVGISANGRGWRCFECDASGDAITLVAYSRSGQKFSELGDTAKASVREWCQRFLGLDTPSTGGLPQPGPRQAPRAIPEAPESAQPTYPPAGEVSALWEACSSVCERNETRTWLEAQCIDPIAVASADLARALPLDSLLPAWAALGSRSWGSTGYLLVVPLVDARGRVASLLARRVIDGDSPKSVAARGYQRAGLVLACGLARQLLSSGRTPDWWGAAPLRVEICEGEKKFLLRAARHGDAAEHSPVTIGIESGSWKAEHAARLPAGCEVFCSTDPDDAGAKYASVVVRSLEQRICAGELALELRAEHELVQAADGQLTVKLRPINA